MSNIEGSVPEIDDDLAAAFAARFTDPNASTVEETVEVNEPTEDDEEELEEEVEGEEEQEEEGGEETTEPPTGYQLTLPDGTIATLSPEQALAYYQFDQRLSTDPNLAAYIQSYGSPARGEGVAQVPPAVVTPPPASTNLDDLDLDDPNIKFLVDRVTQLQSTLENQQQAIARHEQSLTSEQSNQANALISSAQQSFRTKYDGLSDTDIQQITDAAARTGIVATYMAGVHPITGLPVSPDPIAAMDLAFESVYWANPTYRQQAVANQAAQQRKDRIKKQKAGALSGNSGSTPRNVPNIMNEKERREAMVAHVAADTGME